MNLGRFIFGLIVTAGIYYWYDANVLSKLDIESQISEYEENFDPRDFEEYEDEDDKGFAYDDYDTESDW